MALNPFDRRKRAKVVIAVLAVGIGISTLLAIALVYMSGSRTFFE